ncbi:MFS transporter [Caballeronia novacaledonica]|uniref:MFS transporter n=1 Tax=Caballeronia novacaledonica TaxID=1544861 RepID=UPI001EE2A6D0|nr:MFS transporter [Caballeronia novacaledonica]GJH10523.1 MFS transporter [Caballeronia novacaledonica]
MRHIDVQKLCDEARFRKFHLLLLCWCALIIIFDGYDLAVVGIALPSIMSDMGIQPTSAGFMVSSALLGMMLGAVFLGTIADRIGRVPAIVICLLLFSVFTAAAGFTRDPVIFGIARFLAGLGIGGVMPNVVAQMTEYSPRKIRSTMVTVMFSGYSIGGMLAALVGKAMIERYGWQSVFIAAGFPALLAPVILKYMPESLAFLIRNNRADNLKRILPRVDSAYVPQQDDSFALSDREAVPGSTIARLFAEGRGLSTVMLWIAFFMCLFMVYALSSWLTKLMASAGHSLGSALTFVLVLNFGAMIGAIGGGWLADRFNIKYVLIAMYALAAISISLLGVKVPIGVLFFLVGLAGASTIGTQIVTYAFAGQFYPMAIRSTGIGWASGIGRSGAILAPIVIGFLVSRALPLQQNFVAIAIPGVIAMLAVCLIDSRRSPRKAGAIPAAQADPV